MASIDEIVNAFIVGENAHEVDRVTSMFSDDATVVHASGTLRGKDEIRAWQQGLADGHFSIEVTGPLNMSGSTVNFDVVVGFDTFRQMGLASLDGTEEMAVEDGKITNFTFGFTPEAVAKLQGAATS
jgi:ketosteroid isomerase-like protein